MTSFKSKFPDVTIPSMAVDEFILEHFDCYGDRVAMIDGDRGHLYTYQQMALLTRKIRLGLADMGFKQGDVFAIFSPNCPEYALVLLAVFSAGGVVTTLNPSCTVDELVHHLGNSEAKFLITVPAIADKALTAKEQLPNLKELFVFGEYPGCRSYVSLLDNDGRGLSRSEVNLDDVVLLPFSSGTTGLPKGVMLTHRNVVSVMCQCMSDDFLKMCPNSDCVMALPPFFHSVGHNLVMMQSLRQGVKMVVLPQFRPESFLRCIQDYKITVLYLVPPLVLFLATSPLVGQYDLSSVRRIFIGAAPLSYGLSEISCAAVVPGNVVNYGPSGQLLPNTEIKIVEVDTGKLMGPGEDGEVWLKGPQVMKGYLKNPEATAKCIDKDGFFHTGDIGHIDEEDYLWIVDRLNELIKYQTFQVPPAELEALLLTHPEILDAAVISVPDQSARELPKAYVVRKTEALTAETVVKFVADNAAPHKWLRGGVEFLDQIPKSASGKILRRELRKRLQSTQGATDAP